MKLRHLIFTISFFTALLGQEITSHGAPLPSKGRWDRYVITHDTTIVLTANVDLYGTITIKSGCTLTIENNTTTDEGSTETKTYKRIQAISKMNDDGTSAFDGAAFSFNNYSYTDQTTGKAVKVPRIAMFLVEEGATLRMIGKNDNCRIAISGAATNEPVFNGNYLESLTRDKGYPILNGGIICSVGTVILEHTLLYNAYSNFQGAAILVPNVNTRNIKTGPITLKNCEIRRCMAGHGAAIMLKNQNPAYNTDPEECAVTLENVHIHKCWATNLDEAGVYVESGGGGIIRTNGSVVSNLKMKGVLIEECRSECHGSSLYWNAHGHPETLCAIDGCTFTRNIANDCGGGMVLESSFEFVNNPTTVSENKAGNYGGGIYIMAYNGALISQNISDLTMDMNSKLFLSKNSATYGGGVSFNLGDNVTLPEGSSISVNINGANIKNNQASANGGGIHFYNEIAESKNIQIALNINSGDISSNHADNGNGGGIFCTYKDADGIQKAELNFNAGTISKNTAINGAGIFIDKQIIKYLDNGSIMNITSNTASNDGGGLYISNGGSLVMNACNISSNNALRGGGICIVEGTCNIANGTVASNTGSQEGGGLYVSNSSGATITVSGGKFSGNNSYAGGGICVNGAKLIFDDGIIEQNTANNGGGIYLFNNAKMDFGNGLIRNNLASAGNSSQSFQTGYQTSASQLIGIGGGIFMDGGTILNFTENQNLGLYGNLADYGADDIFANGMNTSITLPDVSKMQLKDFNTFTDDLFWAEDYIWKDSKYSEGTYMNTYYTPGGNLPERYRNSLELLHETFKVQGGQTLTGYVCLALGYGVLFITVEKHGLKEGDSAIFTLTRSDSQSDIPFRTIILTGNSTNTPVSKTIAISSGVWTVKETDWSWSYTSENKTITREISSTSTEQEKLFSFTNASKSDAVLHDEDIVVNNFKE